MFQLPPWLLKWGIFKFEDNGTEEMVTEIGLGHRQVTWLGGFIFNA